ncbi:MAG: hypothetical protein ACLGIA_00600 [Actinomycetes bacterium]
MDHENLFLTRTTSALLRLEYGVALAVCVVLAALHWRDVSWPTFVVLFAVIDVVGYLPGRVLWATRGPDGVPKACYVLYNVAHSGVTSAVFAGLWCLLVGPKWALLALPIHLLGDRALFGSFLKPFGLAFEPTADPGYVAFRSSYARSDTGHPLHAASRA